MADVTTEVQYTLTVTDRKLRIITLALGHMSRPDDIKPRGTDRQEAWELNKELLKMKRNDLVNKIKSAEGALKKIDEIELAEAKGMEAASMH